MLKKTIHLLVLTLAVFMLQVSVIQACMLGPGIAKVSNPAEVIEKAYFIGVVEVLWMKELENKGQVEAVVRPVQIYKTSDDFAAKKMKVVGFGGPLATYCNSNAVLLKGTKYIEIIISKKDARRQKGKYRPEEFHFTTVSLGQKYWVDLRQKSQEADEIKAERLKCLQGKGKWHGGKANADATQGFWCYLPEK